MNRQEKIQKFVRTKPTIEQIVEFVEQEAQRRVEEIKQEEELKKAESWKAFSKKTMSEQGDNIKKWANEKDSNPDFVNLCKEIIQVSKS